MNAIAHMLCEDPSGAEAPPAQKSRRVSGTVPVALTRNQSPAEASYTSMSVISAYDDMLDDKHWLWGSLLTGVLVPLAST